MNRAAHVRGRIPPALRLRWADRAREHAPGVVADCAHRGCLMHVEANILASAFHESTSWLGPVVLLITSQDLGALDDLMATGVVSDGLSVVAVPSNHVASLTRLTDFLRRYLDRDFESSATVA